MVDYKWIVFVADFKWIPSVADFKWIPFVADFKWIPFVADYKLIPFVADYKVGPCQSSRCKKAMKSLIHTGGQQSLGLLTPTALPESSAPPRSGEHLTLAALLG